MFKFEHARNYSTSAASDSPPGLRERNKQAKLVRIKGAARRLFEKQGVEATTIRQIASAADIGLGTVFSYTANKEDLLVMIFREEVGETVKSAFASLPKRGILEQFLHVFDAIVEHHRKCPELARVFVKEIRFIDDRRNEIGEFMRSLFAGLTRLIDQSKTRGEIRPDVPSELLTQNLFAIFFNHLQLWLGGVNPKYELEYSQLRDALELQLAGLRNSIRSDPRSLRAKRKS
jgi:TetR/AcrR family transcriptional regulator, cholesterol catabolism regulator